MQDLPQPTQKIFHWLPERSIQQTAACSWTVAS